MTTIKASHVKHEIGTPQPQLFIMRNENRVGNCIGTLYTQENRVGNCIGDIYRVWKS